MGKNDIPVTPAIRLLRQRQVDFELVEYDYEEHGGTRRSSSCLGVDEHAVVKTLVLERCDTQAPFMVLMHGDREVSLKEMARVIGTKAVRLCSPETAHRHTGYLVGGTSPFGTRKAMPVYAEKSIFDLPQIHINAGRRGLLARLSPQTLTTLLQAIPVDAAAAL